MTREQMLDRAVYSAAWRRSAFGHRAECLRLLRGWLARRELPFESLALIRAYLRNPNYTPELKRA